MGAATRGGGAVESGPKNKVIKATSEKTGPVMMARGGAAKKKPKGMMAGGMAGGMGPVEPMRDQMMREQMMVPGMKKGGAVKKKPKGMMAGGMMSKGMAAGGKR